MSFETPTTPFDDLDSYLALPRLSGLVLSPDGTRLVTSVATLDAESTSYRSALWEVDPAGELPARRLTRGAKGESGAAFTADGDLLFTATRPDPLAAPGKADDPQAPSLWRLSGGEAELLVAAKGGVTGVRTARASPIAVVSCSMMPSAKDIDSDDALRAERTKKKVSAILHSGFPVRYWDSDLGPSAPHLMIADLSDRTAETAGEQRKLSLSDLTPGPGAALREAGYDITPDGRTVVSSWSVPEARGGQRSYLLALDRRTGEQSELVSDHNADLMDPVISPDGSSVAYLRESRSTPEIAPALTLHVVDLAGGEIHDLAAGWDRWPGGVAWLPDGGGVLMTADDLGRSPIFRLDLATDEVTRLTDDPSSFSSLQVAPDGSAVYAIRTSYLLPPHVVRVGLIGSDAGIVTELPGPSPLPQLPGTLTEVNTTTADGTSVRAWLAQPSSQSPAPLLLWVHGGPLSSWNAWSWRWNPWLMVAAGYSVLLPDPALSTGYGQEFIQRGWGSWGSAPYTDLMAITDSVIDRADIDETRTAAMGGSFGGYMANWIAGHTDRFRAIVTHASLWALDSFGPTTDAAYYWAREMSPQMAAANSPHRFVDKIATPMLVIHGDHDYRVPIGEGLRLWYELISASTLALDAEGRTPHRLLYFPDESHWVLTPQNAKVWYQVVLGYLAEHVLGEEPPALPEVLG